MAPMLMKIAWNFANQGWPDGGTGGREQGNGRLQTFVVQYKQIRVSRHCPASTTFHCSPDHSWFL